MQPYFFPYLGYYSLIKQTDLFIVIDLVQFIRQGWIERNRILKPDGDWTYISVPLEKHSQKCRINEVRIRSNEDWQGKIFRQIEHYKKKAYYYDRVIEVLHDSFKGNFDSITLLNTQILKNTCNYLGVKFNYNILSQMNLELGEIKTSTDWPLNISKVLGAKEYYNPPRGIELYEQKVFSNAGIDLKFIKNSLTEYDQGSQTFVSGMSIIDVMMFNSPESIRQMLDQYELLTSNSL